MMIDMHCETWNDGFVDAVACAKICSDTMQLQRDKIIIESNYGGQGVNEIGTCPVCTEAAGQALPNIAARICETYNVFVLCQTN